MNQRSRNYTTDGRAHRWVLRGAGGPGRGPGLGGDARQVINAEDELTNDLDEMILNNLAAGCTACGARIKHSGLSQCFEIGDGSGAPVWVRNLPFTAAEVEMPFTDEEPGGTTQDGTSIIPAGSMACATIDY
jgi:hypothetical protein